MSLIFSKIILLSFYGTVCFPFILIFRYATAKYSKKYSYSAWFIMFFNLIVPFKIPIMDVTGKFFSRIGGIKNISKIPEDIMLAIPSDIISDITISDNINLPDSAHSGNITHSINISSIISLIAILWFIVFSILIIKHSISLIALKLKLRNSTHLRDNIYRIHYYTSPFAFGVFNAKIYLTENTAPADEDILIYHEKTHICHLDNLWLLLVTFITCLHWFNPFVWIAVYLFKADMEFYVDEVVVEKFHTRKNYASLLLLYQTFSKAGFISGFNLNKNFLRERINQIMMNSKIKKSIFATTALVIMAGIFVTVPRLYIKADSQNNVPSILEEPDSTAAKESEVILEQLLEETHKKEELLQKEFEETELVRQEIEKVIEDAKLEPVSINIKSPIQDEYKISAKYEMNSSNGRNHSGIDLAADMGTNIYAVDSGTVIECGFSSENGNYIIINHDDAYQSHYYHCNEITKSEGDNIYSGEKIATVGSSGMATGPHLHFAIKVNGSFINVNSFFQQ